MTWSNIGSSTETVRKRINREPLPLLAIGLPWVSIILASMANFSPIIASAPIMAPLAYMMLLGWRMMRPGMLPVWAGLPLGFVDDLYSGQPFGSGILLWSISMLAMEIIDERFLWRGFAQDWMVATLLTTGYLVLCAVLAGFATSYPLPFVIMPQVLMSAMFFPVVAGIIALLDRIRLLPLKRL